MKKLNKDGFLYGFLRGAEVGIVLIALVIIADAIAR